MRLGCSAIWYGGIDDGKPVMLPFCRDYELALVPDLNVPEPNTMPRSEWWYHHVLHAGTHVLVAPDIHAWIVRHQ